RASGRLAALRQGSALRTERGEAGVEVVASEQGVETLVLLGGATYARLGEGDAALQGGNAGGAVGNDCREEPLDIAVRREVGEADPGGFVAIDGEAAEQEPGGIAASHEGDQSVD